MNKFTLTIDTDSAAFDGQLRYEVARILYDTAGKLAYDVADLPITLRDANGNTVGTAQLKGTRTDGNR